MQCNYLHDTKGGSTELPNKCKSGPADYITSEEDRNTYCIGDDFKSCPRFKAILRINESINCIEDE